MNTTDPNLKSWIDAANEPAAEFPIQSLPYCLFRRNGSTELPRIGIGIGDTILELKKCAEEGYLEEVDDETLDAVCEASFNALLARGHEAWSKLRANISTLLQHDVATLRDSTRWRKRMFVEMAKAELFLPGNIGDYSDFYASEHHATNVGSMFRPEKPLMPNWKHLPVGYHGRASSIVVSGTPIRRPMGQVSPKEEGPPDFAASKSLDYELELGCLIGPGNALGTRIPIEQAHSHIFGIVLVNDWSARDIQRWEYQPLGPFNAKNFATTISPWIVPLIALEPFGVPAGGAAKRAKSDPKPLPYLTWANDFGLDVTLEVSILSAAMRERGDQPFVISTGSSKDLYWTFSQMIAHHTSTGCNLRPMDLIASGTISGTGEESRGCLLERTWRGEKPITLPDGTTRKFLDDGDEVIFRGWCQKKGAVRISLGQCRGVVTAAE